MSEDAERVQGYRFPAGVAAAMPRPTGTLAEILARVEATSPERRIDDDFARIERALLRLEQAVQDAMQDETR
jgi:hypothetical protein